MRSRPWQKLDCDGLSVLARRLSLLVVLLFIFSQCTTIPSGSDPDAPSDLTRTWQKAWVFVPKGEGARKFEVQDQRFHGWRPATEAPPPTVILYLHGCTGLGSADDRFLRKLAAEGFVVIAPDSFARRYRPMQCDPRTKTGGHNLYVYDFRQAEINFALLKLAEIDWVDPQRLFLIGASEGGVAAALYRGSAFRGRIITHWTCQGGRLIRGLDAAEDEPILAIVQQHDPWYANGRTVGQSGDCGSFMQGRPNAHSMVLDDGSQHDVFTNARALKAIFDFLNFYEHK